MIRYDHDEIIILDATIYLRSKSGSLVFTFVISKMTLEWIQIVRFQLLNGAVDYNERD